MSRRAGAAATALLITVAFASQPLRAGSDTAYYTVTVGRISVVSIGGAKRCSRIASKFVRFEGVLRELTGWDSDVELPALKVFLISQKDADRVLLTDEDKRSLQEGRKVIYSKFLGGRELNIAAMVDEDGYDDPMQSLFLLYAQSLLVGGPSRHDPAWYQLGVSNILNGLVIKEDGSVILNRELPFVPDVANRGKRVDFDLPQLLAITRTSGLKTQNDWSEFILRARNWAQFGVLTTPARRAQYRDLAMLIRQGTPVEEAVNQAFGVPLAQLTAEYADNRWRREVQFRLPAPATPVAIPEPAQLDPAAAADELGILEARVKHTDRG